MNIPILSNETITREQLYRALSFDIYRHVGTRNNLTKIVNFLFFNEILKNKENLIKNHKTKSKFMDALRQVVLNLYIGYLGHTTIKYPRNKARYNHDKRYGRLWFKYSVIVSLIDMLERLGYLEQKIGFFNKDRRKGKESRIWITKKLLDLFNDIRDYNSISKEQPCEIIQLKDEQKKLIGYRETQSTDRMRKRLKRYNDLISFQNITLRLEHKVLDVNFLHTLWNWIVSGMCEILELTNFEKISNLCSNLNSSSPNLTSMSNLPIPSSPNLTSMSNLPISNLTSHIYTSIPLLSRMVYKYQYLHIDSLLKNELNEQRNIALFKADKLFIKLNYIFLHRVFNNGKFSLGGRFYGSVHQQLPKDYRKHIFINDNPTVELDYSALHIRMLYHLEGVDFRKDPYEGIEEREKFKTVQLILINAKDRKKAVCGIRKELMEMGYRTGLKDEDIEGLIETFVSLHPTISKFLHSGVGLKLQNIDSKIMDNILTNLTKMGIPALPVHDSVIVEKGYEEELKYQMVNCYKKVIGFEPVVH